MDQSHLLHATLSDSAELLAVNSYQDGVRVFDINTKKRLHHFDPQNITCGLRFSNRDKWLSIGLRQPGSRQDDSIKTYEIESGYSVSDPIPTPGLFGFDLACNGSKLLARTAEGASVWDVSKSKLLSQSKTEARLIDSLSGDGKWALTATTNGETFVWKCAKPKTRYKISTQVPPSDIKFITKNEFIVVDGRASLWKIR